MESGFGKVHPSPGASSRPFSVLVTSVLATNTVRDYRRFTIAAAGIAVLLIATGCGGGGNAGVATGGNETAPPPPQQHAMVTTYRNNNNRTGVNSVETKLTPANVNVVSFGKLAAIPVLGDAYAQPLYMPNVTMSDGQLHNVVIVATEHDQVYAIDATTRQVLWQRSFLDSDGLVTPVPSTDLTCEDITPEVGITGTPVIDPAARTIYLVARTKETQNGQAAYYQRLHVLRLSTGQDRLPPTTVVTPSDPNGGFGSAVFDPLLNNQRSALLLENGKVYVSWASHCDSGTYSGWLMAFDSNTLQLTGAWAPDPSGLQGGIWMSGSGPAADSTGDLYVAVGNGWSDVMLGGTNYGDALVRLHPGDAAMSVSDYFMPFDYQRFMNLDLDFGSGGPVLLPAQPGAMHSHLLVTSGKDGTVYLLDCDNLGKWHDGDDSQIVQSFQPTGGMGSYGTPAFWNNTVYFSFAGLPVQAYVYDPASQLIQTTPASGSSMNVLWPGSSPVVSANGSSDAVLWTMEHTGGPGILHAFDPANLTSELYDSQMSPDRDQVGIGLVFAVPTVADGQVFVGAHNELDIYGLL